MKRSRIKPVSDKRRALNVRRLELQEAAWGPKRWWRCWFKDRPAEMALAGPCAGIVDGHEILKRSRSGKDENLIDIDGQVPLCRYHNGWIENWPIEAHRMGLAKHSWE